MKVLVTGATGFIGTAVVVELLRRGHRVTGLARNDTSASKLRKQGIAVHVGDVQNVASVIENAKAADAVIHTAFSHDFSKYLDNCRRDGDFLMAVAQALAGSGRTLVATSVTPVTSPAPVSTENIPANPEYPRAASERFLEYADRGVITCVVRLPMSVHGPGDNALIHELITCARTTGYSAFVGDGANRWSAVHRNDAARLYCDAVEGPRTGARYHAVHDEGVPFRDIATQISSGLGLPAKSIVPGKAVEHFGSVAMFALMDAVASSELTQKMTGWHPREADLLSDINAGDYFVNQRAACKHTWND